MKIFVRKLLIFSAVAGAMYVCFAFFILPPILQKVYGPNVEEQLITSFDNAEKRNYELLILGNSRLYCGINPDMFDVAAYNFSHNNDTYNQLYHKLTWILEREKPVRYVILGVDYFQFSIFTDTRNYVYGPLLGDAYVQDYQPYRYLVTYLREMLHPYKLRALINDPIYKHDIKSNGQFIRNGNPDEEDFIQRNPRRLNIQIRYFERILEECRSRNIKVLLCLPPMRQVEIAHYEPEQIKEFNDFIHAYVNEDIKYLDYSAHPAFDMTDFVDFTHLSQAAADKFSALLNEDVNAVRSESFTNIVSAK